MTHLEARIRLRLRAPMTVSVWMRGEQVFQDDDVVKMRQHRDGVRVWCYWWGKHQDEEVRYYWFPRPDEVWVER